MPRNPSSPSWATTESGIQPSASHWPAWGASSERANSRAVSRIMRCSSLRKSLRARVSMVLLRVFFVAVDRVLRFPVHVGPERLGLVERLHLGAERVVPRTLERRGALGFGVDLGGLLLAARRGEQCRRAEEKREPG